MKRGASFSVLVGTVALLYLKGGVYISIGLAAALFIMLFEWRKMNPLKSSALYILGNIYIAIPIICWIADLTISTLHKYIPFEFIVILGIVSCSDTFAFIGGSLIGGAKMAPKISPSKTWSGAACGIIVPSILAYVLFNHGLPRAIITGIIALSGVFGDLIESKAKRILNVKDSGTAIPGHGGVLDRLDSFLFASYIYFLLRALFNFYYTADL
ncbi:MAG: phosphatidate cytidylyltransferase [Holosporales bacterium]|nr:phosphatidate cytidylyltransferase [Holosporales bacterium]